MSDMRRAIYKELRTACGPAACAMKLMQTAVGRALPGSGLYRAISRRKHRLLVDYITRENQDLLNQFAAAPPPADARNEGSIWLFWWQGEAQAPQPVKACVANVRRFSGGRPVVVVSRENYGNYVTLPPALLRRVEAGLLSPTHLSDVVRMHLLRDYGGLWLDASFYLTAPIPQEVWDRPFFSARMAEGGSGEFVSANRWVIGLMGAVKGTALFGFLAAFLDKYWQTHDAPVDYLMTDYAIAAAAAAIPAIGQMIDALPVNNTQLYALGSRGSQAMSEAELRVLTRDTQFFRIPWRVNNTQRTPEGDLTWYGYFCDPTGAAPILKEANT